jgi:hypothetical protein
MNGPALAALGDVGDVWFSLSVCECCQAPTAVTNPANRLSEATFCFRDEGFRDERLEQDIHINVPLLASDISPMNPR